MNSYVRQSLCATLLVLALLPGGAVFAQPTEPDSDAAGMDSEQPADEADVVAPVEAVAPPAPVVEIPAAAAADKDDGEAGYDKAFYIKSADGAFLLKTEGRVQSRYSLVSTKAGDDRELGSAFEISRARLTLAGHAFSKDIAYKLQTDFGKGFVSLKDFYIDYKLGDKLYVRTGQAKRPFSRQQINSSGRLALVDRAITDKFFKAGRDIGVTIHNNYEKSPDFEWAVGVYNGTGDKAAFEGTADPMSGEVTGGGFTNVPDVFGPALVARAGINRGGIKGYSEGDLEGGPLRFAVAASVLAELDTDDDDASVVRAGLDYALKVEGISSTGGVYVASAQDGEGFADQAYDALGFHLQGGYMLARKHEAAVRFAMIVPEDESKKQMELMAGYSLYAFAHNFKWQSDVGLLSTGDGSLGDVLQVRTQLQLTF